MDITLWIVLAVAVFLLLLFFIKAITTWLFSIDRILKELKAIKEELKNARL